MKIIFLWHLRCLPTAGVASNYQHILLLKRLQDALANAPHWQLLAIAEPLFALTRRPKGLKSSLQALTELVMTLCCLQILQFWHVISIAKI